MRIGDRELGTVGRALIEPRHWTALRNMMRLYRNPVQMLGRYLLRWGSYPATVRVRTPQGTIALTAYSYFDVLTINEIFCRLDYRADSTDKLVVDFGSNIGISAAYFLTRSPETRVYLFEPLATNVVRLRENLKAFEGRYELAEVAVGPEDGEVTFGWEESGRYGGVGVETGNYVTVPCWDSNRVLREILAKHGRIDILKIDIEGLEATVTSRIPAECAEKIGKVYTEWEFAANPLAATHTMQQTGTVAQFLRRKAGDKG